MKNLLDSTRIATLFLDSQLRIRRFTSEATKIINLIQSDVGRPVNHIVSNLEQDTLSRDAQEVLDSLVSKERAVRTKDGRWYLNRVIPYRTLDNVIDGVVITFTDITEQKTAESIQAARNLAEGIVETVAIRWSRLTEVCELSPPIRPFTGSSKRFRTRPLANSFTISETVNGISPDCASYWKGSCRRTARSIISS